MAQGDNTFFEEALDLMLTWDVSDDMKCAVLDNTVSPTASFATPALGDFTEVGTAGTYTAGGTSIGTWGTLTTEAAGVLTFDSATNPTWAQDASNDTDAFWGLVYNATAAGSPALLFIDLAGPVDMTAGDLTISWNASGIFTITIT